MFCLDKQQEMTEFGSGKQISERALIRSFCWRGKIILKVFETICCRLSFKFPYMEKQIRFTVKT